MTFTNADKEFMSLAVALAARGGPETAPNPKVGAVVVKDGEVIGSGWHKRCGEPHAERNALSSLPEPSMAQGATMFVTLEPCSHTGRTGPCADALIDAGVSRVVIGMRDPNPKVDGGGFQKLHAAGVTVQSGLLAEECARLNPQFIALHVEKRPYVIAKWAQTTDGFIAPEDRSQKWISGPEAKKLVHTWRANEMAIMVGTTTALHDNPQLTTRLVSGPSPTRLILDRTLRLPADLSVFTDHAARTIVVNESIEKDTNWGSYWRFSFNDTLLPQLLARLASAEIYSLLVEGGPTLLNAFFEQQLIDEVRQIISPTCFDSGVPTPKIPSYFQLQQESMAGRDRVCFWRSKHAEARIHAVFTKSTGATTS